LAKALRLPAARAAPDAPWPRLLPEKAFPGIASSVSRQNPHPRALRFLAKKLLESEGVTILESRVDLKRHLWKPPVKSMLKHKTRKKRIQK